MSLVLIARVMKDGDMVKHYGRHKDNHYYKGIKNIFYRKQHSSCETKKIQYATKLDALIDISAIQYQKKKNRCQQ